jgi:hypothetical protein
VSFQNDPEVGATADAAQFDAVAFDALALAICVDDVRPEPGFGGTRERGSLGFLIRLYEEFGCKATLFVPTNWQGRWPLAENMDWLQWLLEQPCFEVACHGHLHAVRPDSPDPGEFRGLRPEAVGPIIQQSLAVFRTGGCEPVGFKPPGWFLEPSGYAILDHHFQYVADHVVGQEVGRLRGGRLLRYPYLYTIDRMGAWPEGGLVALQSHVAPEGAITNGWSEALYGRVRAFVKTGARIGAQFVTLGELAKALCTGQPQQEIDHSAARRAPGDRRLYGGQVRFVENEVGVVYNATGEPCPLSLKPENATIAILSRNRRSYLADLLKSVDETSPEEIKRVVLLNNCEDDSAEFLKTRFPNWQVVELNDSDYPEDPPGLAWLESSMPEILPVPRNILGPEHGWTAPRSIGWLTNQLLLCAARGFVVKFDDDFVVKPGWWEYYVRFQQEFGAHAVINNFGAFVMSRSVPQEIGWADERSLGSHGHEDTDYCIRLSEGKVRWVLGLNKDHDWRSAEEENPRGSMTGADYFVHRYAFAAGGFAARREDARRDPVRAAWNERWFRAKWEETEEETGLIARPPFVGVFFKRKIAAEPDWHPEFSRLCTRSLGSGE